MSTIKDVSAYTGLALGTISKYLNGGYVRPENKILLDQAVSVLDYQVNQAARNLKQRHKKRIGVMIPTEATAFDSEIFDHFEEELRGQGYSCMLVHFQRKSALVCQTISTLRGIVDGIILISGHMTSEDLSKTCGDLPVILIDHGSPCDVFDTIKVDYSRAASDVVEKLVAAKHARFGLITERDPSSSACNLYESYRQAITNRQINIDSQQILECEDSFQAGFNAYLQLMKRSDPPTSILVTSPLLTLGVIASARQFGIPPEASPGYVGFSASCSQFDSMPILIVKRPLVRMVQTACALMISRVHQDKTGFPADLRFEAILSGEMPLS